MDFDFSTHEGRAACIAENQRRLDDIIARNEAAKRQHTQRCTAIQRAVDEYVYAINEPLRQLAADIRRSMRATP